MPRMSGRMGVKHTMNKIKTIICLFWNKVERWANKRRTKYTYANIPKLYHKIRACKFKNPEWVYWFNTNADKLPVFRDGKEPPMYINTPERRRLIWRWEHIRLPFRKMMRRFWSNVEDFAFDRM